MEVHRRDVGARGIAPNFDASPWVTLGLRSPDRRALAEVGVVHGELSEPSPHQVLTDGFRVQGGVRFTGGGVQHAVRAVDVVEVLDELSIPPDLLEVLPALRRGSARCRRRALAP